MRGGNEAACIGAGVVLCVVLGGCANTRNTPVAAPVDPRGITPRARSSPEVADLRIPQQPAATTNREIPVVPLPIPASQQATGPVVPVSGPRAQDPPGPGPMPLPSSVAPAARENPVIGIENVRRLQRLAAERYATMDSYIVRLTRHEVVRGENKPEEVMLFKFRKEPWSVYFKWIGPAGFGREVVFVKGHYENKMHTLLAAGDMPLAPAGKRMALAPDSIFVRNASRHPITEAGLGASVERLGHVLSAVDRGDYRYGTLNDLGTIARPEFARPVPAIEHVLPPGMDPNLPRGGRCLYCFDPDNNLPTLVTVRDDRGQEVEYYRYDRLQFPVRLDDNDFNPDKLWAPRPTAGRP